MGLKSRRKGKAAEIELAGLLRDLLGEGITRNLQQSRDGGCDLLGLDGWAPEVKRQERAELAAWWLQTVEQASLAGLKPVLFYRASRRPWRVLVALPDIFPGLADQQRMLTMTAELDLLGFAAVARESMV